MVEYCHNQRYQKTIYLNHDTEVYMVIKENIKYFQASMFNSTDLMNPRIVDTFGLTTADLGTEMASAGRNDRTVAGDGETV